VMPGIIGTIQATETIKYILGIGEPLIGKLLLVDALESVFQKVSLQKDPDCMVCGEKPVIRDLIDYEEFCAAPAVTQAEAGLEANQLIKAAELADLIRQQSPLRLVDVRSPVELLVSKFPGAEVVPIERLPEQLKIWGKQEEIVFICRTGLRSARAEKMAVQAGFTNSRCLQGGINAWAAEVDPSIMQY
jgi:sulfur-carrier protein adenylyltransferase/sulfurtransferase